MGLGRPKTLQAQFLKEKKRGLWKPFSRFGPFAPPKPKTSNAAAVLDQPPPSMASAADDKPDPHSPPSLSVPDPSASASPAAVASPGGGAPESVAAADAEGVSAASAGESAAEADVKEDEEEAECGFCLFMKAGGCKDPFVAWEKCVEDAERLGEDVVEKCFEVTSVLKKCMDAHADYYSPILRAEQAMADAVANEATSLDGSPKDENSISQSETKVEENKK